MIWCPHQAILLRVDRMVVAEGAPPIGVCWPDPACVALAMARKGGLNWQTLPMTSAASAGFPSP